MRRRAVGSIWSQFWSAPHEVARTVADYTPEEKARLHEAFAPAGRDYRRRRKTLILVVLMAVPGLLFGLRLERLFVWAPLVTMVLWWIVLAIAVALMPRLRCPGCANYIEYGFGPYCPECGSRSLGPESWFRYPRCASCGKWMSRRKGGRRYKIRACTHCGLPLDERGL